MYNAALRGCKNQGQTFILAWFFMRLFFYFLLCLLPSQDLRIERIKIQFYDHALYCLSWGIENTVLLLLLCNIISVQTICLNFLFYNHYILVFNSTQENQKFEHHELFNLYVLLF